jgi:hypothetical protein
VGSRSRGSRVFVRRFSRARAPGPAEEPPLAPAERPQLDSVQPVRDEPRRQLHGRLLQHGPRGVHLVQHHQQHVLERGGRRHSQHQEDVDVDKVRQRQENHHEEGVRERQGDGDDVRERRPQGQDCERGSSESDVQLSALARGTYQNFTVLVQLEESIWKFQLYTCDLFNVELVLAGDPNAKIISVCIKDYLYCCNFFYFLFSCVIKRYNSVFRIFVVS